MVCLAVAYVIQSGDAGTFARDVWPAHDFGLTVDAIM
jgi:hypothetical protein